MRNNYYDDDMCDYDFMNDCDCRCNRECDDHLGRKKEVQEGNKVLEDCRVCRERKVCLDQEVHRE